MRYSSPPGLETGVLLKVLMTSSQMSRDSKLFVVSTKDYLGKEDRHTVQTQRHVLCQMNHGEFGSSTPCEV